MDSSTFQLIRSAGPQQGTLIGIMWIISFICIVNTLTYPFLSLLGMGIGIGSLLSATVLGYQFRWRVCKGALSFGGQWLLTAQMFLYATILMTMGVYLYMQFFDNGDFAASYRTLMEMPENKKMLEMMLEMMPEGTGVTADEAVAQLTATTPVNLALQVMRTDILIGIMVSLPVALLSRIRLGKSIERTI